MLCGPSPQSQNRAAVVTAASQGVRHECAGAEASPQLAHPDAVNLPDLSLIPGGSPSAEDAEAEQLLTWPSEAEIGGPQLNPSTVQTGNGDGSPVVPDQQQMAPEDPLPEQFTKLKVLLHCGAVAGARKISALQQQMMCYSITSIALVFRADFLA